MEASSMRHWAIRGASSRLDEIRQEEAQIRAEFPELFSKRTERRFFSGSSNGQALAQGNNEVVNKVRKRSKMSAAQRKAVSARMKKYWASRRSSEKK